MPIRTVYVVHHSHTDIGYTHGQGRIIRWHGGFIRQAIRLAEAHPDFAWTCETFFPVEQFWKTASPVERDAFLKCVRSGQVGLTGGYLNFSELPDAPLLDSLAKRAADFAKQHDVRIDSAMQADINGCSLMQARGLAKAGVTFLLSCIHPHHGYVPFGKRQELFRWDLGDHLQLLVCHADHYHIGNELGLAPGAEFNYLAGFTDTPTPFDDEVLELRLPAYLSQVEASGWAHEFVIVAVSGLCTDNSPPSDAVRSRIERWNKQDGAKVQIELTTPCRIADVIQKSKISLPTYRGDWPDWWADGVAGDPDAVSLFRQAQRDRRWLQMVSSGQGMESPQLESLDDQMALFAEHTFGHSASVSSPWHPLTHHLRLKKLGYAADAADLAEVLCDEITDTLGGGGMAYNRPPLFRIVNPSAEAKYDLVELQLDSCDSRRWPLAGSLCVKNASDGTLIPHQVVSSLRGTKMLVGVSLEPEKTIDVKVERGEDATSRRDLLPKVPDLTRDLLVDDTDIPPHFLQTEHVSIRWSIPDGITTWRDVATDRDLLDANRMLPPFTLRASRLEIEKAGDPQSDARRKLGRNRNGLDATWVTSQLRRIRSGAQGSYFHSALLEFEMPGFELLQVRLDARCGEPRVDVEVIMHKLGTWDAENVYLTLPFSAGDRSQVWLDRGLPMRPAIDQLPGTLIDYYGVQDGIAWCQQKFGVAVAQFDSHLVQLGPLDYTRRELAGQQTARWSDAGVHAWLMSNYWETNFSPELSGFYAFRFSILWGESFADPTQALNACRTATTGLRSFRLADG